MLRREIEGRLGLSTAIGPLVLSKVEGCWSLEAETASKNYPKAPVPRAVPSRSQTTVDFLPQECLLGNVADYYRALPLLQLVRISAICATVCRLRCHQK